MNSILLLLKDSTISVNNHFICKVKEAIDFMNKNKNRSLEEYTSTRHSAHSHQ